MAGAATAGGEGGGDGRGEGGGVLLAYTVSPICATTPVARGM
jgi:hypothetical protein